MTGETTVEMPWGVGPETTLRDLPLASLPPAGPPAPTASARPPETLSRASRAWSAVWPALVGIPVGLALGVAALVVAFQLFLWSVTS